MQNEKTNQNNAVELAPAQSTTTSIHFVNEDKLELISILQRVPPNYHVIQYIFDRAIITFILNNEIPKHEREQWLFLHIVLSDVFRCCETIMQQNYKEPLSVDFTVIEQELSVFVDFINNPMLADMNDRVIVSFDALRQHLQELNSKDDIQIAEYSELFLIRLIRFIIKVLKS